MAPAGAGGRARGRRERSAPAAGPASAETASRAWSRLVAVGISSVVLGVPLAVLGGAAGPYDDAKAWALPLLVAATAVAWIARARRETGPAPGARDTGARLVRGLVFACLAWWVVATATSLAPFQSVLGAFGRGMGLLTMGSTALLFLLVQSECRTQAAVGSLVDTALLGSVPVCVLALAQAAGWDPLPSTWDPVLSGMTVRSTFGSHIFLGSYLVALIPLTAARLAWAFRQRLAAGRWPAPAGTRWRYELAAAAWVAGAAGLVGLASHWSPAWWALVPWGIVGAAARVLHADGSTDGTAVAASLLAGLLAGQVLVVVLTRGRGAFIGMLVGLSATLFALLIRHRAWKALAAGALGLIGVVGFLVLLNLTGSPARSLATLPLLSRLSEIGNVRPGSPGWVRLQVWRGILDGWQRQLRGDEVIPGQWPRLRTFIGYGLESQLVVLEPMTFPFLGTLATRVEGARARYAIDRAHNVFLDHLVTAGLLGLGLWVLLLGAVLAVGVSRIRTGDDAAATTIRMGALGAVLAHLAEGQVGIATPMSLALFWLGTALLTRGSSADATPSERRRPLSTPWWGTSLALAAVLSALLGWASTRWLLASVAYADGTRHGVAGRMADAYRDFRRSVALAPGLPLPAEAAAYAALRLAGRETDLPKRLELLHEAEAIIARTRRHALGGAGSWALAGQVALAEARAGEPNRLVASREAFAAALRLRPDDASLLAQSGWAWMESGDPRQARWAAERALVQDPREWLAWAVLARSTKSMGDAAGAERAGEKARELAPPEARRLLDAMLP